MQLNDSQMNKCHTMHDFFRRQTYEYLSENGIFVCRKCRGTGLYIRNPKSTMVENIDLSNFCETCKGVGYIFNNKEYNLGSEHFICYKCLGIGVGCKICDGKGIIDWISNLMRKEK